MHLDTDPQEPQRRACLRDSATLTATLPPKGDMTYFAIQSAN
ncbi:hypothetical protein [Hymenobacter aerilatus]|nr:hypothetical protein [Hymenobacter aerilatus]